MSTDGVDENQAPRIKVSRSKRTNNQSLRKLADEYDTEDTYDERLTKTLRRGTWGNESIIRRPVEKRTTAVTDGVSGKRLPPLGHLGLNGGENPQVETTGGPGERDGREIGDGMKE